MAGRKSVERMAGTQQINGGSDANGGNARRVAIKCGYDDRGAHGHDVFILFVGVCVCWRR